MNSLTLNHTRVSQGSVLGGADVLPSNHELMAANGAAHWRKQKKARQLAGFLRPTRVGLPQLVGAYLLH